jgi:hypothetical protein
MELRYDLMKMKDLERFKKLLGHYKKIPKTGLTYGLTDNARETYMDHDDEECWEEMALLFVTPSLQDVHSAADIFMDWAMQQHPTHTLKRVNMDALALDAKRYWLYILR